MSRKRPLPVTYKPDELKAAIAVLQNNSYHNFEPGDAAGIVHTGRTGYGMDDLGQPKS